MWRLEQRTGGIRTILYLHEDQFFHILLSPDFVMTGGCFADDSCTSNISAKFGAICRIRGFGLQFAT